LPLQVSVTLGQSGIERCDEWVGWTKQA